MGDFAGIVRNGPFKTLDKRLNDDAIRPGIAAALSANTDLLQMFANAPTDPAGQNGYTAEEKKHIEDHWLGPQNGPDTFFDKVPLAERQEVLRKAYLEAIKLKDANAEATIRTVWVCLWGNPNDPTFLAGVLHSGNQILVQLLAFVTNTKFQEQTFRAGPGQEKVFLVGRGKAMKQKFLLTGAQVPTEGAVLVVSAGGNE